MTALPLAGPSSPLRSGEVRRAINWEPIRIESGTGKGGAQAYLKQLAGLRFLANIGTNVRALKATRGRLFAVNEAQFLEIHPGWTTTAFGNVALGNVAIDDNETQVGVASGGYGYAFDLAAATLTPITADWPGATTLCVLDGYGILTPPNSNHFYLTANQDFTENDPLDFASAESTPGDIVAALEKHRELILLKERSGEVWYNAGTPDFPLARNDSAVIEIGCGAPRTLQKVGGIAYWLGTDDKGKAVVFGMSGYEPVRVSSDALEEKLATIADLSEASAWTYHQEGQSRYVLNVPGLDTTWVYNVAAGIWHERGEWDGVWKPWRATCHAVAFGMHIVGDAEGNLYELAPTTNKNDTEPLRRLWRSPHNEMPQASMQRFSSFEVLCDVGKGKPDGSAPTMLLRYSNDGGQNWESWIELTLGAIGETLARARDTQLGSARDRVWEIVVTDDVQCNVITALVNEQ